MKRAVITGPTGAIGIALIQTLVKNGIETTAVVRPDSPRKKRLPQSPLLKVVECGLNELDKLKIMLGDRYDVFYHFGWDGTFGNSRNNMYGQNANVKYALDAVEAAYSLGCTTFVGAGSQAEYGRVEGDLNAGVFVNPENGYGIAKLCAGQMTRIACEQRGIKHIWTRILSVYGPYDQDRTVVMSTIGSLLEGKRAPLTKGEQKWDFLYSMDAGYAMYLLGDRGVNGRTYCLGSGVARPLREYMEILADTIDSNAQLGFGEVAYGDKQVMYLRADITDLQNDTGFVPQYSFEQGIKETIEWYKENH